MGQTVSHMVGLTNHVLNVHRKLRNSHQMALLACTPADGDRWASTAAQANAEHSIGKCPDAFREPVKRATRISSRYSRRVIIE